MKILSPAGNFDCLKVAVYNGADEVYLGINDFNARNNIDGFTIENLIEAVDFAHVFGVKVHLAINILFKDEELQSALDTVVNAFNLGVDAFIVQDIGLAKLISANYPEIELHASTQMGLHNLEGVKAVEKYGFTRVVLARETPLEEIKRIKENSNVEIEYFAQGALCVSFSGNCYLSSYCFDASGNRGKCKQLCRLPYSLKKDGKTIKDGYLLSAKDFCLIDRLSELKKAGVDAIKIEGRARRPFYVAAATKEYRNALDGREINFENLKLAFNRGYTAGYFDGNGKIISELQNHIGVYVGVVEKVNGGKTFNEVFFNSNRVLSPKSTFKIIDNGKEKATLTAFDLTQIKSGKYRLTTTHPVDVGDKLNLIIDANIEEKPLKTINKRAIDVEICATLNKPVKAVVKLGSARLEVFGDVLCAAKKQPLTVNEIIDNFSKSDIFNANLKISQLDDVFIPKSSLNQFRRDVFNKTYEFLTEIYRKNLKPVKVKSGKSVKALTEFQFVESLGENFTANNIIFSPEIYDLGQVNKFKEKCERLNKCAYLDTPNFALKADIELLSDIINKSGINVVANNYYALTLPNVKVIGGGLNVFNCVAAAEYIAPIIASESGVIDKTPYSVMTLRHCPMKAHIKGSCDKCPYIDGFEYVMSGGKRLKLKRKKLSTCTFYLVE